MIDMCHLFYTKVGVYVVHTGIGVLALFVPPAGFRRLSFGVLMLSFAFRFFSEGCDATHWACTVVLGRCDT